TRYRHGLTSSQHARPAPRPRPLTRLPSACNWPFLRPHGSSTLFPRHAQRCDCRSRREPLREQTPARSPGRFLNLHRSLALPCLQTPSCVISLLSNNNGASAAAIDSRILFDTHAPASRLLLGRHWHVVCAGTNTTDSLRPQR